MSQVIATQAPKAFSKITVTLTLESTEELKVFRAMVGRDNTLPQWLQAHHSINVQEGITLSSILDNMYCSVSKF